jgi:hypothetical protein
MDLTRVLPRDLLFYISLFLTPQDFARCLCVNKAWKSIDRDIIWKTLAINIRWHVKALESKYWVRIYTLMQQ